MTNNYLIEELFKAEEKLLLFQAIKEKDFHKTKRILSKIEFSLEEQICDSFTPLQYAVIRGCTEIVAYLLEIGASVDNGTQLILERINKENKKIILLELIKAGINVNEKILDGDTTILINAVWEGDIDLVKTIVEAGADVNAILDDGNYALLSAADSACQEIFDYLAPYTTLELREEADQALQRGLIYRQRLNDQLTKNFTVAAAIGDLQGVIDAITNNVNVNAFDSEGFTSLYLAATNHHPSIVHTLLEAGANVEVGIEDDGETPLIGAASDTYLIYQKPGYSVDNIKVRQMEVVETLIKADANVNTKTTEGWNALAAAANASNTKIVKILLSAGADVNTKDEWGDTALSRAMRMGNTKIIKLLIEAGAKED
ncbi:ankyrin repeat domain-containing protein [Crocosphaera sp. Alani8]|uniref:ankyrin repeat domain-containing protein n=1 Tax=Crocosphaera sp. Alani8 TaxID=3038952 RepID=UPI00313B98BC